MTSKLIETFVLVVKEGLLGVEKRCTKLVRLFVHWCTCIDFVGFKIRIRKILIGLFGDLM